uniref:Uncharacterized protein n=1 Tax=Zeugodacus cucurbitae TaxID=28588 RepID=A0A0A1WZF5_ZEUCU
MLALKQMPLKAKTQTTATYKTTLESMRKLQQQQQQQEKPVEITAAAAKLYNSYDGPQTRVAKKPNTNHNNNHNNNEKQQQHQQLHAATLTTSFLSAPPDVSKHSNDVLQQQQLQQQMQQQQQMQPPQQQQQKLAQNITACNDKLTKNSSSNSNITSNVSVKRVNFDLPQKVVDSSVVAATPVEVATRKLPQPPPPAVTSGVTKFSTQASSNSSSLSSSGSRNNGSNSHVSSRVAALGNASEDHTNSASASKIATTSLADGVQASKTLAAYQRNSAEDTSKAPLSLPPHYARKASNRAEVARTHLSPFKHIVYNGTYPIDLPLQSRFDALGRDYDPEANAETTRLKYTHLLNDYDLDEQDLLDDVAEEDEDEDDDDDEDEDDDYVEEDDADAYGYNETHELAKVDERMPYNMAAFLPEQERPPRSTLLNRLGVIREVSTSSSVEAAGAGGTVSTSSNHHAVWSMQELIANPSIPLNYQKMCHEVEQSLTSFEKYLDSKTFEHRKSQQQPVRTYDIDGPIGEPQDKKHI